MGQQERFSVVAIPLSRPEIVDFLLPPSPEPRGVSLRVMGQRPTERAEAGWTARLQATQAPTATDLLTIDDPHSYLVETQTDRLVPVEFLAEPEFLTKNLGGWAPIYLDVVGLPAVWPADPLLNQAERLADYGRNIHYVGANARLVAARLQEETGYDNATVATALGRLSALRRQMVPPRTAYIERIYAELAGQTHFAAAGQPPIPPVLLQDELLGQLVRVELGRRAALANGNDTKAGAIEAWQSAQRDKTGLKLILKGEYIMGRHRRSTILIAPSLGVVIKQPAPEPHHEIELGARLYAGKQENWPYATHKGQLVTPRGRLRLIVEENLVPRLTQTLGHKVQFCTLLGLIIEPFVAGQTVQELVLADPRAMEPELYDQFILHQQVCEQMGIENGDWHSANFIVRADDGKMVHVDWGAARPLREDELTPQGRSARLNQVQNIAYSFHRQDLAERVLELHAELIANEARLANIRQQARSLVEKSQA